MQFKPKLLPTLFTIPAIIILLCLGTWQMQRLHWKKEIISLMNEKSSAQAGDLPADTANIEDLQYRKFLLKGHFLNDKEVHLFVGTRSIRGEAGYDLLTPLKLEDGRVVIVDRGWIPSSKKDIKLRPETISDNVVEVEGMLHKGEAKKYFTPENNIKGNLWFWIDLNSIYSFIDEKPEAFYIRALKKGEGNNLPIAGDAVIKYRNDHLEYAITWYSLAIILFVIYVLYHFKKDGNKA